MTAILLLALLLAPATRPADTADMADTADPVREVAARLTGSFDSSRQAAEDPRYFDVSLRVAPVWPERDDGPWLYVEQALASAPDRPYRQRVYRLLERDGEVVSEVYALPGDPLDFAGAWRRPGAFDGISPADLAQRAGCDVVLSHDAGLDAYVGGTQGRGCASDLNGAAHATSEVRLFADRLESWDRGYDAGGVQVWGAEAGPYVFRRAGDAGE